MSITSTPVRETAAPLAVSVRGVGRSFAGATRDEPDRVVLRGVDLEVAAGEIVALIGPSGCGKSTLLREVSGLDAPTDGTVRIGGRPVAGIDLRCAVAFQEPRLLPWRTIEKNVALGLPRGTDKVAGARRVAELLKLVGLSESTALRPRQVSGGMAQRVSLARALSRGPGVLVLDEPFGALDALTRLRMQDLLLDVHAAEPATILLVTHDVDEALYLADRVVLLGQDPDGPVGSSIRRIIRVTAATRTSRNCAPNFSTASVSTPTTPTPTRPPPHPQQGISDDSPFTTDTRRRRRGHRRAPPQRLRCGGGLRRRRTRR